MLQYERLFYLILVWSGYFILHSLAASLLAKKWFSEKLPQMMPFYRVGYNLIATLTLIPPLVLMWLWRGELVIHWQGVWAWLTVLLAVVCVILFYHSTRFYDMAEFLGLGQSRAALGDKPANGLVLSPYHRFVRHPWYSIGLLMLWTRDMDIMQLSSTIVITLYLIVGSYWEERKLVLEFGDAYRRYQKKVPGLIPLPWRFLRAGEPL